MDLTYEVDQGALKQGLKDIFKKQLPYARALALTADAYDVQVAWKDMIKSDLKEPTPFTVNSVAVLAARKSNPVAVVFLKDIAAEYLEPFVDGGRHALGKKQAILAPKNVALNQYGNLPRAKIAALKAEPNVYIGPITLKSGTTVNGVWQRSGPAKGRANSVAKGQGTLKLLIRFSDPLPVTQRLPVYELTRQVVARNHERNFDRAWQLAVASAK